MQGLNYAQFPVVSALSGKALGGGGELLLHSDAVQRTGKKRGRSYFPSRGGRCVAAQSQPLGTWRTSRCDHARGMNE